MDASPIDPPFDLVIRGATLPNGEVRDVGIVAGEIAAIEPALPRTSRRDLEGGGALVVPGLVDGPLTLARSCDDPKGVSRRLLEGGVTTLVADLTGTAAESPNSAQSLASFRQRCASVAALGVQRSAEEGSAIALRAFGPRSERDESLAPADLEVAVARAAREGRLVIAVPAEWGGPAPASEIEGAARFIGLARRYGARIHLHAVSTAGAADLVADAKAEGLFVTAGTCPRLLAPDSELASGRRLPPRRSAVDVERLQGALRDGTLDVLASNHVEPGAPDGETFVADLLALIASAAFDLPTAIERASLAPERLFGLGDGRGIAVGARAEMLLLASGGSLRGVILGSRVYS